MDAWPLDSTKRSRSNQPGSVGLWRRCRSHRATAMSAMPMGAPGWPELACCTASMDSARIALAICWASARDADVGEAWESGAVEEGMDGLGETRDFKARLTRACRAKEQSFHRLQCAACAGCISPPTCTNAVASH